MHMDKPTVMREKQCTESLKRQYNEMHLELQHVSHSDTRRHGEWPAQGCASVMQTHESCSPSLLHLCWPVACALGSALAYP